MKSFMLLNLKTSGLIGKTLISVLLAFQANFALSQNPELLKNLQDKAIGSSENRDCVYPPTWNLVIPSVSASIIQITNDAAITINGVAINICDWIGCF